MNTGMLPALAQQVMKNRQILSGGFRIGLNIITVKVSGPKGNNLTAHTYNVSGTSKSLSPYYFDSSNPTYAGVPGTYYVALWIKDTANQTDSRTFTVTVQDNYPYFSSSLSLANTVILNDRIYFTGTARDAVGLKKVTVLVSGPKGNNIYAHEYNVSGTSKTLSSYYFDSGNNSYAGLPGNYFITLWIKDRAYQTHSKTFNVTVQDKYPYFSSSPTLASTVTIPGEVYFTGTAQDQVGLQKITMMVSPPQGGNLTGFTYNVSGTWKDLSSYSFDSSNPSYAGVPGIYSVALYIKDTMGQHVNKHFYVTVNGAQDNPPTFNPQPTLSASVTIPESIPFTGTARDDVGLQKITMIVNPPQGGTVTGFTYNVTGTTKNLSSYSFDSSNPTYANVPGMYQVGLWIKDTLGQPHLAAFTVHVNNDGPTFSPTPTLPSVVTTPNKIYFSGMVRDTVGLQKITVMVNGPRGNDITGHTYNVTGTLKDVSAYYFDSNDPSYAGVGGTYHVALWIKDTHGQAISEEFNVLVNTSQDDLPYFSILASNRV
ncbi:MAG: hypothetical protein GKR87_13805 [Kiritimatiellae bacterium]|nr:hypothetical protein [Kiritimatiellia bacterium]